jgi:hypothetical protein
MSYSPPPTASATAINRLMRDTDICNSLAIAVIVMPHSRDAMRSASGRSAVRLRQSCDVLGDLRCAFGSRGHVLPIASTPPTTNRLKRDTDSYNSLSIAVIKRQDLPPRLAGKRRVIDYLFSPVQTAVSESLGER